MCCIKIRSFLPKSRSQWRFKTLLTLYASHILCTTDLFVTKQGCADVLFAISKPSITKWAYLCWQKHFHFQYQYAHNSRAFFHVRRQTLFICFRVVVFWSYVKNFPLFPLLGQTLNVFVLPAQRCTGFLHSLCFTRGQFASSGQFSGGRACTHLLHWFAHLASVVSS